MFGFAAAVRTHRGRGASHHLIRRVGRVASVRHCRARVAHEHAARTGAPEDQSHCDDRLELEKSFCVDFHCSDSNAVISDLSSNSRTHDQPDVILDHMRLAKLFHARRFVLLAIFRILDRHELARPRVLSQ